MISVKKKIHGFWPRSFPHLWIAAESPLQRLRLQLAAPANTLAAVETELPTKAPAVSGAYRRVLVTRPFLLLWIGVVVCYLTDRLIQLGLLEMVRPSVAKPGAVNNNITLFMMLPFVFLSPMAGPLVDRRSRRAILVVTALSKAAILAFLAFLLAGSPMSRQSLGFVYGIVLAGGILTVFFSPARTSLVPQLIASEDLMAANSLMNVTGMFMMLLGNFVAAFLLGYVAEGVFSLATFFWIGTGAYVTAVALFGFMRAPLLGRPAQRAGEEGYIERLRAGLRYAARHRVVWRLVGLATAFWFLAGAVYTILNGRLLDELQLGTDELGYALGVLGVAVFAGGFAIAFGFRWLPSVGGAARLVFLVVGISVLSLMALQRLALLLVPIALIGVAGGGLLVLIITLIQRTVPKRMHGRIFSIVETCQNTALIVALIGGSITLERGTGAVRWVCWTVGGICLTAAAVGSIPRRPRRLRAVS